MLVPPVPASGALAAGSSAILSSALKCPMPCSQRRSNASFAGSASASSYVITGTFHFDSLRM